MKLYLKLFQSNLVLGQCFCTLASYLSPDDDPQWSVMLDQVGNMSFVMIYLKRKQWNARLYSRKDFRQTGR